MESSLRCDMRELVELAKRYVKENPGEDDELLAMKPGVLAHRYLTKAELQRVAHWKTPRTGRLIERNAEEYVQEITGWALTASTERARIQVLTLLDGVQWPTASVILHFFHPEPYPILDFRTLWSLSLEEPNQYHFTFWWNYVQACRQISNETQQDMRSLDRGLWQYSKESRYLSNDSLGALRVVQ